MFKPRHLKLLKRRRLFSQTLQIPLCEVVHYVGGNLPLAFELLLARAFERRIDFLAIQQSWYSALALIGLCWHKWRGAVALRWRAVPGRWF